MTLEIILIVFGIILLVVSVIFTGNEKKEEQKDSSFSEEEIANTRAVLDKMAKESLESVSEDTIVNTDDVLSKISNEKIMSINEFSETNLEKIKENHDHVVFLYNMLNQKDDEIKQTLADMETARQEMKTAVADVVKLTKKLNQAVKKTSDDKPVVKKATEKKISHKSEENTDINNQIRLPDMDVMTNRNEEILNLHKQGMSVLEISKALQLGQGEVKLVIDLYGA